MTRGRLGISMLRTTRSWLTSPTNHTSYARLPMLSKLKCDIRSLISDLNLVWQAAMKSSQIFQPCEERCDGRAACRVKPTSYYICTRDCHGPSRVIPTLGCILCDARDAEERCRSVTIESRGDRQGTDMQTSWLHRMIASLFPEESNNTTDTQVIP